MESEYDKGFKAGKQDAQDCLKARASRKWKRAFLDGYSDGYHADKILKRCIDMDEFSGYDHGARAGMFDKCNGKPRRDFTGVNLDVYATIYIDGYNDAYNANEVKIDNA